MELLELKLVRLQHLELVDLCLELVGDLEKLDRSPIGRQQGAPLWRRASGGNRQGVFLAFSALFIERLQNRLVEVLLAIRQQVDQERQEGHAADQGGELLD